MASGLTRQDLDHFKAILAQRQQVLSTEIRETLAASEDQHYVNYAHQIGDAEDRALADLLQDENLAAIHRDIEEYRAVLAAQDRIARGTYGQCIDCGGDIAVERLEAYPTAARCIDCQANYERTHASGRHPTL